MISDRLTLLRLLRAAAIPGAGIGLALAYLGLEPIPKKMRRAIRANLTDCRGRVVRRVRIPRGTPFVYDLTNHRYYDLVKGATYRRRTKRFYTQRMKTLTRAWG